jgi:hypothetical protein
MRFSHHLQPKRDFHETVVGFSEQRPIGLTVKIAHVPEIADSFHDLLAMIFWKIS